MSIKIVLPGTLFRRASIAALALVICPIIGTSVARADPQPPPQCTGESQLTSAVLANVCMAAHIGYPNKYYFGEAWITNTSGAAYLAELRVDTLAGTTVAAYGNACAKWLSPGQKLMCTAPTVINGGPYHARARISTPGYLEFIDSPDMH